MTIQDQIRNYLHRQAAESTVTDVRVGLGYTAVQIDKNATGLAWTPPATSSSCTHINRKQPLAGSPAKELLAFLTHQEPLYRAIGLATANALLCSSDKPEERSSADTLELLGIRSSDRVAMVGFFGPLIPRIRQTGCQLDIIEQNREHQDTLAPQEGMKALSCCDIAIITATSLINNSLAEILPQLKQSRKAVLLGPSAPLCAKIFSGTPITQISGSRVIDGRAVLQIVSEGGGTQRVKPYVAFETVFVP